MNTRNILNKYFIIPVVLVLAVFVGACTEEIDTSARYTFTGQTVISYLEGQSQYEDYVRLLKKVNISKINENAKVYQLLTARGNYTVFAPTDSAIDIYLKSLVTEELISQPSWDAPEFKQDSVLLDSIEKVIVYNSILDGGDNTEAYQTSDFVENLNQELAVSNMNDRKVKVTKNKSGQYVIGDSSAIDPNNCNIYVINGRIHCVDRVVALSTNSLATTIRKIIKDKTQGYYIMCRLMSLCHIKTANNKTISLLDTLSKKEDENYYYQVQVGNIKVTKFKTDNTYLPEHLRIGFTLFAEPDNMWLSVGAFDTSDFNEVANMDDATFLEKVNQFLKSYNLVPSTADFGTNYSDENNAVNLFVTYHLLPERIGSSDMLAVHYNELWYNKYSNPVKRTAISEFYTTMGVPRLMKVFESVECHGIYIDRFPVMNNARTADVYNEVSCDNTVYDGCGSGYLALSKLGVQINTTVNVSLKAENATVYQLGSFLGYNDQISEQLAKQRIRWDVTTMFPEMMTNNIRLDESKSAYFATYFPTDNEFPTRYLQNCWIEDGSQFNYLNGYKCNWLDWQGDELNIRGQYDFIMKLPPVPRDGHYELRLSTQSNSSLRGMCQVYFGTNKNALPAAGIPLDMRMGGEARYTGAGTLSSIVGWEADDTEDQEANAEVDKKMRNNDYMKAPNNWYQLSTQVTARANSRALRRIVVSQDIKANETYYIRFKSVLDDKTCEFFMDYMEWCPKEVYDNPSTPEDIW